MTHIAIRLINGVIYRVTWMVYQSHKFGFFVGTFIVMVNVSSTTIGVWCTTVQVWVQVCSYHPAAAASHVHVYIDTTQSAKSTLHNQLIYCSVHLQSHCSVIIPCSGFT